MSIPNQFEVFKACLNHQNQTIMRMYKTLGITLTMVLLLTINSNLLAQWQQDSKYGFKINIPADWSKKSYLDGTDQVYDYMSADENLAVQLRVFDAGAGFTTALLAQVYEENMLPAGTSKLSLNDYTTANGIPSKKGVYLIDYNGTEVGLSALYIVQNNFGYVLTAFIPSSMLQQKGPELKQIIKSFSITGFHASAQPSGLSQRKTGTSSNTFKIIDIQLSDRLDANNNAISPGNRFGTKTAEIFAVVDYRGEAKDDFIVSWIYNDWNRTISRDAFVFNDKEGGLGVVSLTKPTNDWPVGNYTVKFEMGNRLVRELGFTVTEQSTPSGGLKSSGNNQHQFTIQSHYAYDFKLGRVLTFAKSTGEGFALYGGCQGLPEVEGKFIITYHSSFEDSKYWDRTRLHITDRNTSKRVPLNKVCVCQLRDGSYAKFMFVKEEQADGRNGCIRTLSVKTEYPVPED
jgi:hypothetical protein